MDNSCPDRIISIALSVLEPHPAQRIFLETSEAELEMLADDLARRGQQQPIEVVPSDSSRYWIICGRRRYEAAKLLGETSIKARVRCDLAEAGPHAIEEHLIQDNFCRQQLSDFDRAVCALRLRELAEERKHSRSLTTWEVSCVRTNTRDSIGAMLGIGGRQVSRLLRVFDVPQAVQDALRAGRISLGTVNKIARLSTAKQAALADALLDGDDPVDVVRDFVGQGAGGEKTIGSKYRSLLRQIEETYCSADVVTSLKEKDVDLEDDRETLTRGTELIRALETRLDELEAEKLDWDD